MAGRELLEADALTAFAAFAQHRNITTAATELRISQPSLHVKVRKLSAALGVKLYERDGRRLRLTPAGERLAGFALDARHRVDELMQQLHQELPDLTVAAGRGTTRWVLADPIQELIRQGRTVRLISADRDHALSAVSTGHTDIAVVAHDPPPQAYENTRIASYPQNLVVQNSHPLAARSRVRLTSLDGLSLVVPTPEREHRQTLDHALRNAGVNWHVAAEVDGWDLLIHLTGLGMGATIVNGCVTMPPGLTAVPIIDLPPVDYWAAWNRTRTAHVADLLDQFHDLPTETPDAATGRRS